MATLWIREYSTTGNASQYLPGTIARPNVTAPIAQEPGTDQTPLTFTTTAASAAFGADTTFIRVYSSAAFHYVVGAAPTATTSALKCPADTHIEIGVTAGHKIAAILAA